MACLSLPSDTKVLYKQENPKWPGTSAFKRYEGYKRSKTFGNARANGAGKKDMRFDWEKAWLRASKAKSMKTMKAAKKARLGYV